MNRTNVPREPQKDVNASEDFLDVLFIGHVITSALQYFGMNDIEDDPNETLLPKEVSEMSANEKHAVFFQHISNIVTAVLISHSLDLAQATIQMEC